MYGRTNKLRLPFSSLTEEFMVTRAREVLLWRGKKVSSAGIEGRTGRTWNPNPNPRQSTRLRHRQLVGMDPMGRSHGHS